MRARPIVIALGVIAVAFGAGYATHVWAVSDSYGYTASFPDSSTSETRNLGCTPVIAGGTYESRFDLTANAYVEKSLERVAIVIAQDGKTADITYTSDVAAGVPNPIQLTIVSNTKFYLVARADQTLGFTTLILDAKTRKAVVAYTGQGALGIKNSSLLLQCR